jgi:YidC/Oxa1 family membrane protein insertase
VDRRFVLFLVLSLLIWTTYIGVRLLAPPPQPVAAKVGEGEKADDGKGDQAAEVPPEVDPAEPEKPAGDKPADPVKAAPAAPRKLPTLGSLSETSPYKMAVTFDTRGAAVMRAELNTYDDVEDLSGYLGHLELSEGKAGGALVNVVVPGSPAANAQPADSTVGPGLKPGDLITAFDNKQLADFGDFEPLLAKQTHPEQEVKLTVERAGVAQPIVFTAKLTRRPLEVVKPESHSYPTPNGGVKFLPTDPLSLLMTLDAVGPRSVRPGASEINGLPSLLSSNWEVDQQTEDSIQFSFTLDDAALKAIGAKGGLKIVKRYTLAKIAGPADLKAFHLDLRIEIHNLGDEPQTVAYRLQGPTGLPLEGWWYSTKLHPDWMAGAGARDVASRISGRGHELVGCPLIVSESKELIEENEPPRVPLLTGDSAAALDYAGVDTQFFASAILPQLDADTKAPIKFRHAYALPVQDVNEVPKNRLKTTNVSVLLVSDLVKVESGKPLVDDYQVFLGPKQADVLKAYDLFSLIEYGWDIFMWPAWLLQQLLNLLFSITSNFGIAIILLTMIVRSCMVPVSLRQAKSAAMMQQLAPEVAKIKEKYPEDAMKQHAAVQELYKKHKFNPFGGCLLVFIQLPIFIGLYRCLSVDIDLRDAALFPGMDWITWASNLAGPDKLFYWKDWTWDIISDEAAGWLGPFFNVLPLITVALFLVQQKLFTPPATDEQTKMQQQMMTYMTVFMGVMFYKVPAGLCLYFITSSLWGIAERKMLPKPKPPAEDAPSPVTAKATSSNGSTKTVPVKKPKKR